MTTDQMLNAFATFFVTIDPPGQIAIFLALTVGLSGEARRKIALFGSMLGIGIILLFMVIGAPLLELLGISLPAFRVAGGLLLFYTAFEMVFEKRQERREDQAQRERPLSLLSSRPTTCSIRACKAFLRRSSLLPAIRMARSTATR